MESEVLSKLREFFKEIIERAPSNPIYRRYSVRDWHLVSDELREVLTSSALTSVMRRVTGVDDLILWRSKLFEKLPGDGPIDWHQEYGYFDGEEAGGHRPALLPLGTQSPWNWTVWIALTDVTEDDGVMEFVPGSQAVRYSTRMVPLRSSAAFVDPSNRVGSKAELLERATNNSLIIDVDTSHVFDSIDTCQLSLHELLKIVDEYCGRQRAVVTDPFELGPDESVTKTMNAGEFIVFSERCMHRSRGAPHGGRMRLAISARYTVGSTWVYPQRHVGDFRDGSGLDIGSHRCVKALGANFNPQNQYA
jgi:non-heme Fe2+,alpha-ketoglutarate-dependent halogenase